MDKESTNIQTEKISSNKNLQESKYDNVKNVQKSSIATSCSSQTFIISVPSRFVILFLFIFLYCFVILLISLMNASLMITDAAVSSKETDFYHYHEPGLYGFAKGFNVFFGLLALCTIIVINSQISDYLLHIANLKERSNKNFYLFIISFSMILMIPTLYILTLRSKIFKNSRYNLIELTIALFLAINACVLLVFGTFLLLVSLISTTQSYSVFRFLVMLHAQGKKPPPPRDSRPKQIVKKPVKKRIPFNELPVDQLPTVIGRLPKKYQTSGVPNPYKNQQFLTINRSAIPPNLRTSQNISTPSSILTGSSRNRFPGRGSNSSASTVGIFGAAGRVTTPRNPNRVVSPVLRRPRNIPGPTKVPQISKFDHS